jgi:type IV fimbrial biogenesis protein FimT
MEKVLGYTLMEVLIALTVVVILASVAVPGYEVIQNRSRVNADWNNLHTALNEARTAAVTRGVRVGICPSADGTSCGEDWSQGWLVFEDRNGNGQRDAGEEILRVARALEPNSLTVRRANGDALDFIGFNNRGFATASSTFTLCDRNNEASRARAVLLLNSGRVVRSRPDDEQGMHRDIAYEVLSCAG